MLLICIQFKEKDLTRVKDCIWLTARKRSFFKVDSLIPVFRSEDMLYNFIDRHLSILP